uniref:Interleukin-4 n=1 Tax=Canis lupus familiaris TaxID=9615 RepID=Q9TUD8_CANLF|nr:interleukin-4 precursor [Canis lupus familiaris]
MGLTSQLIPTLVCLLALTSTFVHGHNFNITIKEIIKMLNILTARNDEYSYLTISPVFGDAVGISETEKNITASREVRWLYDKEQSKIALQRVLSRDLGSLVRGSGAAQQVIPRTIGSDCLLLSLILRQDSVSLRDSAS